MNVSVCVDLWGGWVGDNMSVNVRHSGQHGLEQIMFDGSHPHAHAL